MIVSNRLCVAVCVVLQIGVTFSQQSLSGPRPPQKIRITNIEDLINIGFDSLFPEETLTNATAYNSIKFRLYDNTKNISQYKELKIEEIGPESLKPNVPTKLMVHGFLSSCEKRIFPKSVIQAYFEKIESTKSDMNLICVDWATLANPSALPNPLLYGESVKSTRMVGEKIGEFLATLYKRDVVKDLGTVHIIGSSLGAHVAGIAGHILRSDYGLENKLGRITGLDPAGLFYRGRKAVDERLDKDDANFVDVIHTNMGQLGLQEIIGHASFYPNGGRYQERCYSFSNPIAMIAEQVSGRCSHLIAATYFKESIIEHTNITACKAESWDNYRALTRTTGCQERVSFGDSCPASARGLFYLMI
ncbi:lipase member H [Folsomia candida]|uniref:lipase member H n=1 Tax=Folsomia candida TaxID=158441 RepID=UPI000B8F7687|nr:lipase member H [Folsomia candida]